MSYVVGLGTDAKQAELDAAKAAAKAAAYEAARQKLEALKLLRQEEMRRKAAGLPPLTPPAPDSGGSGSSGGPMSTGKKIAVALGVAVGVGTIGYFATRKKAA